MTNPLTTPDQAHRDPVTDAPDFHPVGTGVGAAAGGAAAGMAIGTVAGPVGTVIGAAVGAIAGGLAGKAVAHAVDVKAEEAYWREYFTRESYVGDNPSFDDFGPAYLYGANRYTFHEGRSFDEVEEELGRGWSEARGTSSLDWDRARPATRASWQRLSDRIERAVPGDSDRDGL